MAQISQSTTTAADEGIAATGWQRRHSRVARHVERTALQLMAAQGPDALTVEDIANAAGISRRTYYRYFASVDDMLRAPLKRYVDVWAAAFREQPLETSLIANFHSAATRTLETLTEVDELGFALTIIGRDSEVSTRVRAEIQTYCSNIYFELISRRLAVRGGDMGAARAVSAAFAALMFQVAEDCVREQVPLTADRITRALSLLAQLLGDGETGSGKELGYGQS